MADEKPPETGEKGKKKKPLGKFQTPIIIGAVVIIGIVFVAIRSSNKNANAAEAQPNQNATTQGGINPATGYLYGSPADLAAMGSSGATAGVPGPAGPAGPAGPTGPAGPPGKPGTPAPKPKPHPAPKFHTVTAGENLTEIANKYGIQGGWHTLYHLNRNLIGGNPNKIYPGQRLKL